MSAPHLFDRLSQTYNRLLDTHLCIGITGLSQSGKTTFITSLIHQLLNHKHSQLFGFSSALSGRLLSVRRHPLPKAELPEFPYESSIQSLYEPNNQWPAPSIEASGCLLELRFKSLKSFNPLQREFFSVYLELRDYPGEWLLDLPLRDMNFSRWSSQCSAQYQLSPRRELLEGLLSELYSIDPLARVDEAQLKKTQQAFIQFLRRCKQQKNSLSLIQPGRFLLDDSAAERYVFVPLLNAHSYSEAQLKAASKDSYFKYCEAHYKNYVKELVEPFYRHFFSTLDRQIVLVDLVNALSGGPEYFKDMRQALTNIIDSFRYGAQNRLLQLFNPKIDKVVFAATKIDQVLSQDHQAMRTLLQELLDQAYGNAAHQGIVPVCEAVAAVRAAHEVLYDKEPAIAGMNDKGQAIGYVHPNIPSRLPDAEQWQTFQQWPLLKVSPPRGLNYERHDPLPHIRMDTVLNHLLADKCQ